MEPIRGGRLSIKPPRPILELWDSAPIQRSPAEWALQWVWDHPEVSVVLSGMGTMEHVEENLISASNSGPGVLTGEELALIGRVRDKYVELAPIPCTDCKYCLPCPSGVNIPRILSIYNEAQMYNDLKGSRGSYNWLKEEERANLCIACGECEEVCPQSIEIIEWLEKAHQLLGVES
jgi:predicted aldo/keto reductase-like oxidoreductase